jgi:hypothetical protein
VLKRFQEKGLSINALKSYWATDRPVEYLGFVLTPQGIKPQPRKITAIKNLAVPKTKKQLRHIIGLVNYYRYMWKRRSHILAPLTALLSTKTPFVWTQQCQQSFQELKDIISDEVMLSFPDYTQPFELHTDASTYQLGAVLSQNNKPIAFFSKKLNNAQRNYTVGEVEMLSIVEALKEFRTIIYGYPVRIFTDHKNHSHDMQYKAPRVFRWRMAIEEYMPSLAWIPGKKNPIADILSRHPIDDEEHMLLNEVNIAREYTVPVDFKTIYLAQLEDPTIQRYQREAPHLLGRMFDNTGERDGPQQVITIRDTKTNIPRILVPESIRGKLIHWYHHMLVHPGMDRLFNTLFQHFTWPKMREEINTYTRLCPQCQKGKRGLKGYGEIPLKDVETEPWRIKYSYQPGDKVLILPAPFDPKLTLNQGPFRVIHFDKATGTLQIRRKNYIESINIRRVRPYFGSQSGGD